MIKNETIPQTKNMDEYPEISDISQGISKILETELKKLVSQYNGGKDYPFDLMHGDFYPGAVEGRFSRIIQDFLNDMTRNWSTDKISDYNQSLRGYYLIVLSKELAKDFENITKIDFGMYKDFGKQIPYMIIPQIIKSIEKILESRKSNKNSIPITAIRKGFVTKILKLAGK